MEKGIRLQSLLSHHHRHGFQLSSEMKNPLLMMMVLFCRRLLKKTLSLLNHFPGKINAKMMSAKASFSLLSSSCRDFITITMQGMDFRELAEEMLLKELLGPPTN